FSRLMPGIVRKRELARNRELGAIPAIHFASTPLKGRVDAKPWPYRRELDKRKVIGGELVVPRRYPTALLDPVEEAFDEVANSIEVRTEADRSQTWSKMTPSRHGPD